MVRTKPSQVKEVNIFILDENPFRAASHFHDKLVVKMILESAQMLSTTRRFYGDNRSCLYKTSFLNHPCTIWVRESLDNYIWLSKHFIGLCNEYTYRYNKIHRSHNLLPIFGEVLENFESKGLTPFALAMPDKYKTDDTVQSYRNYYLGEKIKDKIWTNRSREELDSWLSASLKDEQFKSDLPF